MPIRTRPKRIAAVAAVALVTACGPEQAPPPRGDESQSPSPTATTTATQDEALAAYRGMWDTAVAAAVTADPDSAQLRRYASGPALAQLVNTLYVHRDRGEVILGQIELSPTADPGESADTVRVRDCVDTSLWLVYRASGGLVDHEPGGRHATTATVTADPNEGWIVSTLDMDGAGTC